MPPLLSSRRDEHETPLAASPRAALDHAGVNPAQKIPTDGSFVGGSRRRHSMMLAPGPPHASNHASVVSMHRHGTAVGSRRSRTAGRCRCSPRRKTRTASARCTSRAGSTSIRRRGRGTSTYRGQMIGLARSLRACCPLCHLRQQPSRGPRRFPALSPPDAQQARSRRLYSRLSTTHTHKHSSLTLTLFSFKSAFLPKRSFTLQSSQDY